MHHFLIVREATYQLLIVGCLNHQHCHHQVDTKKTSDIELESKRWSDSTETWHRVSFKRFPRVPLWCFVTLKRREQYLQRLVYGNNMETTPKTNMEPAAITRRWNWKFIIWSSKHVFSGVCPLEGWFDNHPFLLDSRVSGASCEKMWLIFVGGVAFDFD